MEETETLLASRRYLYALFQNLFGNEPSTEQLAAIDMVVLREALTISEASGDASEALLGLLDNVSPDLQAIKDEYTRLFYGPEALPAPPWESIYTTGEQVIFQRATLEVRNFYRAQGFIPKLYPKVADDHIALELDFLRLLAERALAAYQDGDVPAAQEALQASADFLDLHLLLWVGRFASDLRASNKGILYPQVAQALTAFTKQDAALLKGLLAQQAL
jgi:TorA maturation chaperone TorD